MKFSFVFGGKQYQVDVHILPGSTPLLFCRKDIDSMGLNYETLCKRITRESDGYTEVVPTRDGLPFLIFLHPSYFPETQLRSMHLNLGLPSVDMHMKLLETADISDSPRGTRRLISELVKHCKAGHLDDGDFWFLSKILVLANLTM